MATPDRRDPVRTLELLWEGQPQPARGPRPALSLDQIVQTAIKVADAEGLAGVSMRRVAEELGFTTMSLYRYVPSKGDLLDLMVDAVATATPADGEAYQDWRDGLARWAGETMAVYRARPWVLEVPVVAAPMGPNQVAWMERALRAMSGSGLTPEDMMNVLMLLTGYVRGHAQFSSTLAQVETHTGATEREWDAAYATMLERAVTDGEHPALAGVVQAGVFEAADHARGDEWLASDFEFGLARILDGVETYIERRTAP